MRIGLAQLQAPYFAKEKNEEKVLSIVREAVANNVQLVLFPEGMNLGYFVLDQSKERNEALALASELAEDMSSPWMEELKAQAAKGIYVACGAFLRTEANRLANTLLVISPEGAISLYHKTHLYHLKDVREENFVVRGDELKVVNTGLGTLGLSICYDLNFPEVYRTLALKGAQVILVPAAWPKMAGETWDIFLRARALENEAYIVASDQTGGEYYGHSKLVDYAGNVVVEFREEEGLKVADIELSRQEKWRNAVTLFEDRRPELYHV